MVMRCHCRRSHLLITPITLKLVTLNPKLKSTGAGRYQLLPVGGMPTASSWPERLLSEKSGTLRYVQIKERGALPMIDRGDIRQAPDCCSNIWGFTAGRWLWSVRA